MQAVLCSRPRTFLTENVPEGQKMKGDTAMSFIEEIKARARRNIKTIVLPESEDRRIYEAAAKTLEEGNAEIVIIGKEEMIRNKSTGLDISKATLIDPEKYEKFDLYVDKLVELRKAKGMTQELARETMLNDYTTFGVMMVKMGDADGLVSGACHSSANTLRPCLQILKTAPGTKLVSAFFLMIVPDCNLGERGTFVFGDCGLNQNPTSEELAAIAESSAKSFELLVGKEAKIAMLSHSTKGSAKHEDIDRPHMSAQAVGGAVGHNPISLIVPCHRVVGTDGSLTGYAGGIDRKTRLLLLENPCAFGE